MVEKSVYSSDRSVKTFDKWDSEDSFVEQLG